MDPEVTNEGTETLVEAGKASANMSMDQLGALLKKRSSSPAVAGASTAQGQDGTAAGDKSTLETEGAGAPAGTGDSSPGDSNEELPEEGEQAPEGEAEGAGDEDGETDVEAEADEPDGKKGIRKLQKRVSKLTERAKAAEERAAAVEAELQKVKQQGGAGGAGASTGLPTIDPVELTPEVRAARQAETQATGALGQVRAMLTTLRSDPEAALETLRGMKIQVSDAEHAQELLEDLRETLRNDVTAARARRERVAEEAQRANADFAQRCNAVAEQSYPWMKDAKSPERQAFEQFQQQMPYLAKLPMMALGLADMVAGRAARLKAAQAAQGKQLSTRVAPGSKPAAVVTAAAAAAPRVTDPKKAQLAEREAAFRKSGRGKDLVEVLKMRKAA